MAKLTFEGGLNENDACDLKECQAGQNFDLGTSETSFHPRPPLALKGTTPSGQQVNGILQLVTRADVETTLIFDVTPAIWLWTGTGFSLKRFASLDASSKLRGTYWSLDDYLIISDISKATPMMKWDGTDCTRLKNGLSSGATANTSITESGGVYTLVKTDHGFDTGDLITIAGADTGFNGEFEVTARLTSSEVRYAGTGSGVSTLPGTSALGIDAYAKYSVVHNGRLWLFNITTDSDDNPHMMVASEFENVENYSTTQRSATGSPTPAAAFYMLTPDLKPINGVESFNGQLVISTIEGKLFRLTGVDATDYAFVDYYVGSAATGTETMTSIGNDVVYMRKGGNIESLAATDTSGDVSANDISRWIPDQVEDLTDAITVYDQTYQKVHFFVDGKDIVLFKDILYSGSNLSPWSIYKTELSFDFNTNAAVYLRRPGESTYSVYVGDAFGNIYDVNGEGVGDIGDGGTTNIITFRTSRIIDELNYKYSWLFGRVQYRRIGECDVSVSFDWSNEYNLSSSTITLKGPTATQAGAVYSNSGDVDYYYGGPSYYSETNAFLTKVSHQSFSPTGKAESFTIQVYLSTGVSFQIDNIEFVEEPFFEAQTVA